VPMHQSIIVARMRRRYDLQIWVLWSSLTAERYCTVIRAHDLRVG